MKKLATSLLVLAGLLAATSAMALNTRRNMPAPLQHKLSPNSIQVLLGCDDNFAYNAYFQGTDDRLGNLFDFGLGSTLSRVQFWHFGFGLPGPYNYDIEVWDPNTCTFVSSKNNLVAGDAADAPASEDVNLCGANLFGAGILVVTLDPNTCNDPTDCYPDLLFDDQLDVFCPVIIANASTSPSCFDVSPFNGPFLLRAEFNGCPTSTTRKTWGSVKSIYR